MRPFEIAIPQSDLDDLNQRLAATSGALMPTGVPLGVAVFGGDMSIRSLIDLNGIAARWTEFDRGGYFPAMEVPALLATELREFFGEHS